MIDVRRLVTLKGQRGSAELVNEWSWKEMDPCPIPSTKMNPRLIEEVPMKCETWNPETKILETTFMEKYFWIISGQTKSFDEI